MTTTDETPQTDQAPSDPARPLAAFAAALGAALTSLGLISGDQAASLAGLVVIALPVIRAAIPLARILAPGVRAAGRAIARGVRALRADTPAAK